MQFDRSASLPRLPVWSSERNSIHPNLPVKTCRTLWNSPIKPVSAVNLNGSRPFASESAQCSMQARRGSGSLARLSKISEQKREKQKDKRDGERVACDFTSYKPKNGNARMGVFAFSDPPLPPEAFPRALWRTRFLRQVQNLLLWFAWTNLPYYSFPCKPK